MLQNCPLCGSFNIQYACTGIICNDCKNIPIKTSNSDNSSNDIISPILLKYTGITIESTTDFISYNQQLEIINKINEIINVINKRNVC